MNVLVTGAGGFLGQTLCARMLAAPGPAAHRIVLVDRSLPSVPADPRLVLIAGDIADPLTPGLERALADAHVVVHLAAIPGGAAERDYAASKRVNLDASLALLARLSARDRPVRFVYASTIAVFGEPLPEAIDDSTAAHPTMTYGAHKLMIETELGDMSRRGQIDGLSIRLPGLLARPAGGSGMKSAFMSELFHACVASRRFVVPTAREATVWVMSATCAVGNLLHAATCPTTPAGSARAVTLPALRVTMDELAAAVIRRTGCDPALVSFERDEALEAQFGRLPPLKTAAAESLGFCHDGNLDALVVRALGDAGYGAR